MPTRVYVILDLVCADTGQVARILQGKPGVAEVDVLAGARSIMMIIEAPEELTAGEYLVEALDAVEGMTGNLRVLPVSNCTERSRVGLAA